MSRLRQFTHHWGFPVLLGLLYWLFDSLVLYFTPPGTPKLLHDALFPALTSVHFIFRSIVVALSVMSARYYEKTLSRVRQLEQKLFLNEYAVEHTKAFAMIWADETGEILKVNEFAASRLGYTKAELLNRTIFDITADHTLEKWEKLLAKLKNKAELTYQTKHRRKDGTSVDAVVFLQYLKTRGEHYQFAFVCDALPCPASFCNGQAPCEKVSMPTIDSVLEAD